MNVYIKERIQKGFLLKEESIRKLSSLISQRIKQLESSQGELVYRVYRKDSRYYETINIDDIIKEDNSVIDSIMKIEFHFTEDEILFFELSFDKTDNTLLEIECVDRDFAYLLASDLKEYITSEVFKFRKKNFTQILQDGILFIFVPVLSILGFILFDNIGNTDSTRLLNAINSNDCNVKLNALLTEKLSYSQDSSGLPFLLTVFGSILALYFIPRLLDYLYPRNIFLIGKEKNKYSSLCSKREKIIWGVIVGFIISSIASLLVWYLTNK